MDDSKYHFLLNHMQNFDMWKILSKEFTHWSIYATFVYASLC